MSPNSQYTENLLIIHDIIHSDIESMWHELEFIQFGLVLQTAVKNGEDLTCPLYQDSKCMPNQRYVNHRCQREQRTKNGNNRLVILLSVNVLTILMDLAVKSLLYIQKCMPRYQVSWLISERRFIQMLLNTTPTIISFRAIENIAPTLTIYLSPFCVVAVPN